MRLFVGVTDDQWFHLLAERPSWAEVNFWRPSGLGFQALSEGELFLFKLHAPHHFIVGGGFFARALRLPLSLAWESFGEANGVRTLPEMRRRIAKYRRQPEEDLGNPDLTCLMLAEPFFLKREEWIHVPASFKPNVVVGKGYDTATEEGRWLFDAVAERLQAKPLQEVEERPATLAAVSTPRFGAPKIVRPRLGQGAFRALVTEAYERRCALTGEKTLPVLEAAHVQPYAEGGPHDVSNGLLLRSDLHRLYDQGYITVDPDDRRLLVSGRIREEFHNGRHYYALEGQALAEPHRGFMPVTRERLLYHAERVYRA
ncbi:HNH endonuclease [Deinococcus sp. HMF7604]|uniref:HNH endonuclease n=1 Tax=Deinococcus betulae TaxID=2873312 RepID=UPI001CCB8ECB|nr:HNH endonuclease [Deinococcus betulae]MBZ9752690.1 HNH endonuclease [Deinococcus betulae]